MVIKEYMVSMRDGTRLFTRCILPDESGSWPIEFSRSPYVSREFSREACAAECEPFLRAGYALVHQSCRGTALSEGVFVPFEHEREDGLDTLQWLREQPFYNGEIYVQGGSYCSYVHMAYLGDCPGDVRGAMLWVMPPYMDRGMQVNGFYKQDVMTPWFIGQYHKNQIDTEKILKDYPALTLRRPLCDAIDRYYEDGCPEYAALLRDGPGGGAWTRSGGAGDARNAMRNLKIPILLMEGWYDIYIGSGYDMWEELAPSTRAASAMLIGPWPHSCRVDDSWDIALPDGDAPVDLRLNWFNHLRTGEPLNFASEGKVTYYTIGAGRWTAADRLRHWGGELPFYLNAGGRLDMTGGEPAERSYRYDPENPTRFEGGANAFCTVRSGVRADREPDFGPDVISFVSEPLEADIELTGGIGIELHVKSDCEDTAFFVRIDACVDGKYLPVQESITSLRRENPDYAPGSEAVVTMTTDPVSWRLSKGDRLRVDVASASWPTYMAHGNTAGPLCAQRETRAAVNTVILGRSHIVLPLA